MSVLEMLFGGVAGFALGWIVCFRLGEWVKHRAPWWYWAINAAVVVLGVVLIALGLAYTLEWLWVGAMGFVTAGLAGLKYGRGKVVGRSSLDPPSPVERDVSDLWKE